MIIKFFVNIILFFIISSNNIFAEEIDHDKNKPVSMQDSLNQSMKNNKRIQSETAKFKAAKYRYEQATRRILPNISANASYGVQHSKIGDLNYESYPEKRLGISLTQDIYTFGRITAASEKARYDMLGALVNIDIIKSEEALKFIRTYLALYGNIKTQNLMKKNIEILQKLINITTQKVASGEANTVDIIQLEAELITEKADLGKTIAESKKLLDSYKILTGNTFVPPLVNPASMCRIIDNKDTLSKEIKERNFEIQQAKYDIESKNQDVELSKSSLYPAVSFSANSRYYEGDSAFFRDEAQTSSAVIQLNIPIFDRGMEYSRIKEAKALKQASEFDLMNTQNDVLNKFESDYSLYEAQSLVIDANKKSLVAMNLLLKKTLREKDLGFKSVYDFLTIKQKVIDTEIDLVNSKLENTFYGCKIIAVQGKLPIVIPEF